MLPLLLCKTAAHDIIAQDARRNADVVAVNAGSLAGGHLQRDGSVTQLAGQRAGAAALTPRTSATGPERSVFASGAPPRSAQ